MNYYIKTASNIELTIIWNYKNLIFSNTLLKAFMYNA